MTHSSGSPRFCGNLKLPALSLTFQSDSVIRTTGSSPSPSPVCTKVPTIAADEKNLFEGADNEFKLPRSTPASENHCLPYSLAFLRTNPQNFPTSSASLH